MPAESYRALLNEHFAAKTRLDGDTLRGQLTPDIRYWAPASGAARGLTTRPLVGRENVVALFTEVSARMYGADRLWAVEYLVADDAFGAAQATLTTTVAATGLPYQNTYAYVFRFEEGAVSEIWEHTDTAWAFQQFDASGPGGQSG
jgi:ketosteroid isomerase-like protein